MIVGMGQLGKSDARLSSPPGFNDGAWHHVVWMRSADGTNVLYLDGHVQAEMVDAGTPINNAMDIHVGGDLRSGVSGKQGRIDEHNRPLADRSFLKGAIDEVALYDYVLSGDRVREHYQLAAAPARPQNRSAQRRKINDAMSARACHSRTPHRNQATLHFTCVSRISSGEGDMRTTFHCDRLAIGVAVILGCCCTTASATPLLVDIGPTVPPQNLQAGYTAYNAPASASGVSGQIAPVSQTFTGVDLGSGPENVTVGFYATGIGHYGGYNGGGENNTTDVGGSYANLLDDGYYGRGEVVMTISGLTRGNYTLITDDRGGDPSAGTINTVLVDAHGNTNGSFVQPTSTPHQTWA